MKGEYITLIEERMLLMEYDKPLKKISMKKYGNVSKSSGISAYENGPDWIKVKFVSGDVYKYSYSTAGRHHVEQMKTLAESGSGLATYISKYVKDQYEKRSLS